MNKLALIKMPGSGGGGGGTITGAENGLHVDGTLIKLGGNLTENAIITATADTTTQKVIWEGIGGPLTFGNFNDAFFQVRSTSPTDQPIALGVTAPGGYGAWISGGYTGILVEGNSSTLENGILIQNPTATGYEVQDAGTTAFKGTATRFGLDIAYGNNITAGQASDFGVRITSNGIGNSGTPLILQIPTFSGTLQNFINMTMSTNNVVSQGYGQSIRFSYGAPGAGSTPGPVHELRSIWSTLSGPASTFSIWAAIPTTLVLQQMFTVYNSGQIQFNKYTAGTFGGTLNRLLGTTSAGAVIEVTPASLAGNPTATVALAAKNGTATTFMRSDGAPALDQTISPTWTNPHVFSFPATVANPTIRLTSNNPQLEFTNSAGGANEKNWNFYAFGSSFGLRTLDDTNSNTNSAFTITRTGNVVTQHDYYTDNIIRLQITQAGGIVVGQTNSKGLLHVGTSNSGMTTTGADAGILITTNGGSNFCRFYMENTLSTSGQRVFAWENTGGVYSLSSYTDIGTGIVTPSIIGAKYDGTAFVGKTLVVGGLTPAVSAVLDVQSTTQGLLLPRMTTAQRNAIASPVEGLVVYDITLNNLCFYAVGGWFQVSSIAAP